MNSDTHIPHIQEHHPQQTSRKIPMNECLLTPNQVPAIPQAHLSLTLAAQGRGSCVIGSHSPQNVPCFSAPSISNSPGEELHSLLDALALGHGHLRHTGRKKDQNQ